MATTEPTLIYDNDLEQYVIRQMVHSKWYEIIITEDLINQIKQSNANQYGYLDAMNDLADVQFIDNTWQEGQAARKEVEKIIKGLCGL